MADGIAFGDFILSIDSEDATKSIALIFNPTDKTSVFQGADLAIEHELILGRIIHDEQIVYDSCVKDYANAYDG